MLRKVFHVPGSLPDIFIYDNCCGMFNHLQAINDPMLKTTGFPVDAFHFRCKHSKKDIVCQQHCDPKLFPELLNDDGTWFFNSSKCEQLNVWLGGFRKIFREMARDKFVFILDELICRKNILTRAKLEKDGYCPSYIPGLVYNMSCTK